MIWYRYAPPPTVLFLPFFVLLVFGASLGVGLWIAALMVEYRDFRFIVPFMVQFGLYISPVVSRAASFPSVFASSTRSIRWWELSMVFAGACWARKRHLLAGARDRSD